MFGNILSVSYTTEIQMNPKMVSVYVSSPNVKNSTIT